jgi:hypothetical protein
MSLEALGLLEDDEELELKKLLSDEVDAGRDASGYSLLEWHTHSLIGG